MAGGIVAAALLGVLDPGLLGVLAHVGAVVGRVNLLAGPDGGGDVVAGLGEVELNEVDGRRGGGGHDGGDGEERGGDGGELHFDGCICDVKVGNFEYVG